MQISSRSARITVNGQEERDSEPIDLKSGERASMVPGEAVKPRFETRLNLLSRQILIVLGERGSLELDGMSDALQVPGELAALAVGWLARSRAVDLVEDLSGKLQVKIRRPTE
jgi:hypothetical protein